MVQAAYNDLQTGSFNNGSAAFTLDNKLPADSLTLCMLPSELPASFTAMGWRDVCFRTF